MGSARRKALQSVLNAEYNPIVDSRETFIDFLVFSKRCEMPLKIIYCKQVKTLRLI